MTCRTANEPEGQHGAAGGNVRASAEQQSQSRSRGTIQCCDWIRRVVFLRRALRSAASFGLDLAHCHRVHDCLIGLMWRPLLVRHGVGGLV